MRQWLACADFSSVLDAVSASNRTISTLITLTYSENPLLRWRAVDAIGRCAKMLSSQHPGIFRNYLRRLFWMMSDESGAFAPHAPEIIGEIIYSDPAEFVDFVSMTVSLLDMEPEDIPPFLPGILYALGRIGEAVPDKIEEAVERIEKALSSPDPQARAMAVWCLRRIGGSGILLRHPELEKDPGRAIIYSNEQILATTVERLYAEA